MAHAPIGNQVTRLSRNDFVAKRVDKDSFHFAVTMAQHKFAAC